MDPGIDGVSVTVDSKTFSLKHGAVAIAAITSCTNTSNPEVMVAAGLVAQKARALGLTRKPWVKTSLAPGSKVVTDYLDRANLTKPLNELGFNLVGYGCTTPYRRNSGPLPDADFQSHPGQRPRRRIGALGQSQLRGPRPPRREGQLSLHRRRWSSPNLSSSTGGSQGDPLPQGRTPVSAWIRMPSPAERRHAHCSFIPVWESNVRGGSRRNHIGLPGPICRSPIFRT